MEKGKPWLITVDPGYDSLKIIMQSIAFKIPFSVIETDERKFDNTWVTSSFLAYRDKENITSRVGQYARELIFSSNNKDEIKHKMPEFYSEKRFLTNEFIIGVRAAIAKAFVKYQKIDSEFKISDLKNYEIYLMIALPHAIRDAYSSSVASKFAGLNEFEIKIGNKDFTSIAFNIKREHIFTVSQTIAAIIGETSDQDGNLDSDRFYLIANGPTLVIDAGYYTNGLVVISNGGTVNDEQSESNTDYAMRNVDMLVADTIKKSRPDVEFYNIEYLCNKNNGILKFIGENGEASFLDLKEIKEEKIKKVCEGFISYLDTKYNNLLDFNYVITDGGTGVKFFNFLKEYYVDQKKILKGENLILGNYDLPGVTLVQDEDELTKRSDSSLSIEYSIAVGAHKALKGKVLSLTA